MNYPTLGFYFTLNVEGIVEALSFQEVSGLNSQIDTEEVSEGGENTFAHRHLLTPKYSNLVLKRGIVQNDTDFLKWINDAVQYLKFKPTLLTVRLVREDGNSLATWTFDQAYPVAINLTDSRKNELMIETLELCYTSFKRKDN